jgi:hypothetical protein
VDEWTKKLATAELFLLLEKTPDSSLVMPRRLAAGIASWMFLLFLISTSISKCEVIYYSGSGGNTLCGNTKVFLAISHHNFE